MPCPNCVAATHGFACPRCGETRGPEPIRPSTKARKRVSPADDTDGETNQSKRAKPSEASASVETSWNLNGSGTRLVSVSEFKGKTMISIREFYEKDGAKLPGKKGISLPLDQWQALIYAMPEIEQALVQKGESVARPRYNEQPTAAQMRGSVVAQAQEDHKQLQEEDQAAGVKAEEG